MIISHKHRFIFLHCRKVAGSSITSLLNRYLGPDDIQVGSWHDALHSGGRLNRQAIRTLLLERKSQVDILSSLGACLTKAKRPQVSRMINHAISAVYEKKISGNPAHAVAKTVAAFDPAAWQSYHKFCFVRNPYHHAVSDYFWRTQGKSDVSFDEFLRRKLDPDRPDPERLRPSPVTNWEIYTINDRIVVDTIGRYETLSEDLARLGQQLGFHLDLSDLPGSKSGFRKKTFGSMFTPGTKRLVEQIYAKELETFEYRFEEN